MPTDLQKNSTHPLADQSVKFHGWAATAKDSPLVKWSYHPPQLHTNFVEIQITHAGICGSDIHTADGDWSKVNYPVIVGHEICGIVSAVGSDVKLHKVGDRVAVGAQCWSCQQHSCKACSSHLENLCPKGVFTYHSIYRHDDRYKGIQSNGGYADKVRCHEAFAFAVPKNIASEHTAPLMCAGATVFAPLDRYNVGKGTKVAVVGIGGLGSIALLFAKALGADVTAVSTSESKRKDADALGAQHFLISTDKQAMRKASQSFDIVICTANVPANQFNTYTALVSLRGQFVMLGMPAGLQAQLNIATLQRSEASFTGSSIGSRDLITKMLKTASEHNIKPVIEKFDMRDVNTAFQRVKDNKIRYRAVLVNPAANSKL